MLSEDAKKDKDRLSLRAKRMPLNLSNPSSQSISQNEDAENPEKPVAMSTETPDIDAPALRDVQTKKSEPISPLKSASPKGDLPIIETVATLQPPPESSPPVTMASKEAAPVDEDFALRPSSIAPAALTKEAMPKEASPWLFWGTMTFLSLLWASVSIAFIFGGESGLQAFRLDAFKMALLAITALFPAGLIFASGYALRQASRLSRESLRASHLADSMVAPAAAAANQTLGLVESLKCEINNAMKAVRLAQSELSQMTQTLRQESEALNQAAEVARQAAADMGQSLGRERTGLNDLSQTLSTQAENVLGAIDKQARMVADASDLAQAQLREAEASLAARATDLSAVASDTQETARAIIEDLDKQTERLETAGQGVADQIRSVEDNLSQQRAGLVSAALSLRADQEDFAVHLESVRGQLTEALSVTRLATVDLGDTAFKGMDTMRGVMEATQAQFNQLMQASDNERTTLEARIHATLGNISAMAADARDDLISETQLALQKLNEAAHDARKAADQAALSAQSRVDRLNETIFEASKKADEIFDARFTAARRLIEDSSDLINEAGDRTAERLDESFLKAREAISDVNRVMNELSASAERLPLLAQERLFDIRKSVEDGIMAMTAAARQAAQETDSIDLAFQERVRRNYEMLSESARLMGVISGGQPLGGARSERTIERPMERPIEKPRPTLRQEQRQEPRQEPFRSEKSVAEPPQDRPRLRLSPIDEPAPFAPKLPESREAKDGDNWSWREVFSGMDAPDRGERQETHERLYEDDNAPLPPHDPEFDQDESLIMDEIRDMNVDLTALMGRSRLEDIIVSIVADENDGARAQVKRMAPSIVRRLGRRLTADETLRHHVSGFVGEFDRQINIALMSKNAAVALMELLGTDLGRAYLLYDAAIGDLL